MNLIWYIVILGVLCLVFVGYLVRKVLAYEKGSPKMVEIADAIHLGAMAFLKTEYKVLSIFVVIVTIAITFLINWQTGLTFILGAIASALSGYVGMKIATQANVRTTQAAKSSLKKAFTVAYSSGAVMGFAVVGLGLLGLSLLYILLGEPLYLIGFSFGACSIALFARVGGGIYTKAADVGADLVGKVEKGIPEDDPRNPAVIADNVGDNVGDVAGMGADLFGSYIDTLVAAMIVGGLMMGTLGSYAVLFPLFLSAIGAVACFITFFVVRPHATSPMKPLRNSLVVSTVLVAIGSFFLVRYMFPTLALFWATLAGLVGGFLIGLITEHYTSEERKHVKKIADASVTGAATNIIHGLAVGKKSTVLPILIISLMVWISFAMGGLYGLAIAGVAMLATLAIGLTIDTYGPVADNAGGIAEMAGLDKEVRVRTDKLDAAGNTTAAIGKGFAIGNAMIAALAMYLTFAVEAGITSVNILDPKVIVGLLIGAMIPYIFSSLLIESVGKAAFDIIKEVRRQFRTIDGLMEGTAKPDYTKCIDISTKASLREMILPGLINILVPIIVGLTLGVEALAGLLVGIIASGGVMAIKMANSGGAWDNAKKYIEAGAHGGKGSVAHRAAVVGDTVGDGFKDTSGPSLNILIKLSAIVALTFLPLFI
ncbi:MAG: sodium-translocating pyrophosphatase [archaeon]